MDILIAAAILWIVPIFVAASIGNSKHRQGILYGLFLGWIGVLILAALPAAPDRSGRYGECPHCRERMRADAVACPHCQRDVAPGQVVIAKPHRSGRLTT